LTPAKARTRVARPTTVLGVCALALLTLAGTAAAYTCPQTPLDERIAQAEAVFVGRATGSRAVQGSGIPQRVYTFVIDQEVKGDLGRTVEVRVPVREANGGQTIPTDVAAGVLASRVRGELFTTSCGITDPGAVLAAVDEQRGNPIRLMIGLLILGLVLAYSVRRVRRKQADARRDSLTP
jgi:hypothetical protein